MKMKSAVGRPLWPYSVCRGLTSRSESDSSYSLVVIGQRGNGFNLKEVRCR